MQSPGFPHTDKTTTPRQAAGGTDLPPAVSDDSRICARMPISNKDALLDGFQGACIFRNVSSSTQRAYAWLNITGGHTDNLLEKSPPPLVSRKHTEKRKIIIPEQNLCLLLLLHTFTQMHLDKTPTTMIRNKEKVAKTDSH